MGIVMDLTGQRFGHLTVLALDDTAATQKARWICACDCGARTTVRSDCLRNGNSKSCGCLRLRLVKARSRALFTKHGQSRTREYLVWNAMIGRCENERDPAFHNYGGRGIGICPRWRYGENGMTGFECYAADMGPRPEGLTLDRRDNDGPYDPSNCRWATRQEQRANQRKLKPHQ